MRQTEKIAKKMNESLPYIVVVKGDLSDLKDTRYWQIKKRLGFKKESLDIIHECAKEILELSREGKDQLYHYLDEDYVLNFLIDIASDIKISPDSNKYNQFVEKIDAFIKNLKNRDYCAYFKIGNLKSQKKYDFNSFILFPNDGKYLDVPLMGKDDIIKQLYLQTYSKNSEFYPSVMALRISAMDENHARVLALQKVNDALNVFRVMGATGIFYEGHINNRYDDLVIRNCETDTLYRFGQREAPEQLDTFFDLDEFVQKNPQITNKLVKLFDINSNALEKKILNSLIWLGESINELNRSHKLLKMVISIESLLLDNGDKGRKRELLVERAGSLLANNFKFQNTVSDIINEAYTVRSTIIHTGEKQIISTCLIQDLFTVVFALNMLLLKSNKYIVFEDIRREVKSTKKNELRRQLQRFINWWKSYTV